jgi:hypothetical protein
LILPTWFGRQRRDARRDYQSPKTKNRGRDLASRSPEFEGRDMRERRTALFPIALSPAKLAECLGIRAAVAASRRGSSSANALQRS